MTKQNIIKLVNFYEQSTRKDKEELISELKASYKKTYGEEYPESEENLNSE